MDSEPFKVDRLRELIELLRSSAKAFRENTVYDSEGDPIRLIVQADECDAAATELALQAERIAELEEEIRLATNECLIVAVAMARHWRHDVPQWRPLSDLRGLISQIDNMSTGITRPLENDQ